MLRVAFPNTRLGQIRYLLRSAARTLHDAIRPSQVDHDCFAILEIIKVDDRFLKCVNVFHEAIIYFLAWYVKYIITFAKIRISLTTATPTVREKATKATKQSAKAAKADATNQDAITKPTDVAFVSSSITKRALPNKTAPSRTRDLFHVKKLFILLLVIHHHGRQISLTPAVKLSGCLQNGQQ